MNPPMKCKDCKIMIPKPKANKSGLCTSCGLREAHRKKDSQFIKSANNLTKLEDKK